MSFNFLTLCSDSGVLNRWRRDRSLCLWYQTVVVVELVCESESESAEVDLSQLEESDSFCECQVKHRVRVLSGSITFLCLFMSQLSERQPSCEDETMVPVLTSRKASELPVNEAACILQVGAETAASALFSFILTL